MSHHRILSWGLAASSAAVVLILITAFKLDYYKSGHEEIFIRISPPEHVENLVLGQRSLIADLFWIRLIQDFSFCDKRLSKIKCEDDGWAYKLLNGISHLDPKLRVAHLAGPLMLSIVIGDSGGASKIFDRAVMLYPTDWPIIYGAAYQALFEEKNKNKAAGLFESAARAGGPIWFFDAAHKLYLKAGQREMARNLFEQLQQDKNFPKGLLENLEKRYRGLDSN
jgi:hypothetical protein